MFPSRSWTDVAPDLILVLLAIALVLNGTLVAVALRQLRAEPLAERAETPARSWPIPPSPRRTRDLVPTVDPEALRMPEPVAALPGPDPEPAPAPSHDDPEPRDETPQPAPKPDAPPRRTRRPRKFTLPPVSEDRDRADRAIEVFLSGGRLDALQRAPERPADRPRATERRAVTDDRAASVAVVAIAGSRTLASDDEGRERAEAVSRAVEETLRLSARADDHVVGLGDGRFRILLVGSTETAARTYLDRVRTACGPWLTVAGRPLDLLTASAQAGADGDLSHALRLAERRLRERSAGTDLEAEG